MKFFAGQRKNAHQFCLNEKMGVRSEGRVGGLETANMLRFKIILSRYSTRNEIFKATDRWSIADNRSFGYLRFDPLDDRMEKLSGPIARARSWLLIMTIDH